MTGDHISSFSLAIFDQFLILSFVIYIFCKTDVVGVNAGVEGMGVIPAVIGNIGHHPPMGLHHQHNHYKQTNTNHFPMRLQKYNHKSANTQMGISASPSSQSLALPMPAQGSLYLEFIYCQMFELEHVYFKWHFPIL